MGRERSWFDVGLFVALTALFTAPFWWLLRGHPGSSLAYEYVFGLMWAPAAAALVVGRRSELGWIWPERRYLVFGYVVPIAYIAIVYAVASLVGFADMFGAATIDELAASYKLDEFDRTTVAILGGAWALSVQALWNMFYALGEEIGWRGFLVPALARRCGLVTTGVISGAIWAAWHVPLFKHADPWQLGCFFAMVVSLGIVLAWLRLRSQSLWPAVVLHGTHNAVLGYIGTMAGDTSAHRWYFDETGAGLAVATAIVAIIVVIRARRD